MITLLLNFPYQNGRLVSFSFNSLLSESDVSLAIVKYHAQKGEIERFEQSQ